MTETLQEFFDSRGVAVRVDRQAGVIRGVKILGLQSRNGRTYLPEALAAAAGLYEDVKVNVNHPKGNPGAPRDYQDRIGAIRNVSARPDGLFADFHFNPKHVLAEQLAWDAEHAPENVGFSHNVEARTSRRGEQVVVETIARVQSVDLVADPATTRGLFESQAESGASAKGTVPFSPSQKSGQSPVEQLRRDCPELVESLCRPLEEEIGRLQAENQRLAALEAAHARRDLVRRLLREFHLPEPEAADPQAGSIVGPRFVESLLAADGETTLREMIAERARLVQTLGAAGGKPLCRDQHMVDAARTLDGRAFAEAIT